MKRLFTILALSFGLLCFAPQSHAQQGPPSATLTWTSVTVPTPSALTYKVMRATAQAGPYAQIANPSVPTYVDTSVVRGTTYWYAVVSSCPVAGNGCGTTATPMNGDSAASTAVSAAIPATSSKPPVPLNLTIEVQ